MEWIFIIYIKYLFILCVYVMGTSRWRAEFVSLTSNVLSKYYTGMVYAIVLYVRLSVCFHDNSRTIRRRMMKLWTIIHILRTRVTRSLRMGHVHDLWHGQTSNRRFYIMHLCSRVYSCNFSYHRYSVTGTSAWWARTGTGSGIYFDEIIVTGT